MKRLFERLIGGPDIGIIGLRRTLRGLRQGDQRELYYGLALAALAFLRRTAPKKTLVYKQSVPSGSAIVVHHKRRGDPKIEVIKPTAVVEGD